MKGVKRRRRWDFTIILARYAYRLMGMLHIQKFLEKAALRPRMRCEIVSFANLPESFSGYRILHLTDFHLDCLPEIVDPIVELVKDLSFDMVVMTGDYQDNYKLHPAKNKDLLQRLVDSFKETDTIIATLGNHDDDRVVEVFEEMGVRPLLNETVKITRGDESIFITGCDDVSYYFTEKSIDELNNTPPGFKILAVHSPELYHHAAKANYDFYIAGHTHGGQVCLPGGIPLLVQGKIPRSMVKGMWKHESLVGFTSHGLGTSGLPIRFSCPPEVSLITLVKSDE